MASRKGWWERRGYENGGHETRGGERTATTKRNAFPKARALVIRIGLGAPVYSYSILYAKPHSNYYGPYISSVHERMGRGRPCLGGPGKPWLESFWAFQRKPSKCWECLGSGSGRPDAAACLEMKVGTWAVLCGQLAILLSNHQDEGPQVWETVA